MELKIIKGHHEKKFENKNSKNIYGIKREKLKLKGRNGKLF